MTYRFFKQKSQALVRKEDLNGAITGLSKDDVYHKQGLQIFEFNTILNDAGKYTTRNPNNIAQFKVKLVFFLNSFRKKYIKYITDKIYEVYNSYSSLESCLIPNCHQEI